MKPRNLTLITILCCLILVAGILILRNGNSQNQLIPNITERPIIPIEYEYEIVFAEDLNEEIITIKPDGSIWINPKWLCEDIIKVMLRAGWPDIFKRIFEKRSTDD